MRIKLLRSTTLLFFNLFLAKFYQHAIADVYLHVPRSSSNRLLQNTMDRESGDRVFDFQVCLIVSSFTCPLKYIYNCTLKETYFV